MTIVARGRKQGVLVLFEESVKGVTFHVFSVIFVHFVALPKSVAFKARCEIGLNNEPCGVREKVQRCWKSSKRKCFKIVYMLHNNCCGLCIPTLPLNYTVREKQFLWYSCLYITWPPITKINILYFSQAELFFHRQSIFGNVRPPIPLTIGFYSVCIGVLCSVNVVVLNVAAGSAGGALVRIPHTRSACFGAHRLTACAARPAGNLRNVSSILSYFIIYFARQHISMFLHILCPGFF